jgi:SAM-dependent methyltransferase
MKTDKLSFKDLFSAHARDYSTFRPAYPEPLLDYLSSLAPGRELAWDCATGNGQAAGGLSALFRSVVATDASVQQLGQSSLPRNVYLVAALAERSPLASCSVDLVTVAQALHWLKLSAFYAEVKRVAKPGAVIACWCYAVPNITPDIDKVLLRFDNQILRPFWLPEHFKVADHYANLPFPFQRLIPPSFRMKSTWNLAQLTGFVDTWSTVKRFREHMGIEPVKLIHAELAQAWGEARRQRDVVWPLHLIIGRVKL